MTNPRPLERQLSSPRDLLDKARRDLARLEHATFAQDKTAASDAMIDACSSVYHLKDWIAVHTGQGDQAERYVHTSKWILLCRDICTAAKHVGLQLGHRTYRESPPATSEMSCTASAVVGAFIGLPVLKIRGTRGDDHYAPDVIQNAIDDWERFLARIGP